MGGKHSSIPKVYRVAIRSTTVTSICKCVSVCVHVHYVVHSIYFPPFRSSDENAAYERSVVNETLRCANGRIPVFPFHWNCELATINMATCRVILVAMHLSCRFCEYIYCAREEMGIYITLTLCVSVVFLCLCTNGYRLSQWDHLTHAPRPPVRPHQPLRPGSLGGRDLGKQCRAQE